MRADHQHPVRLEDGLALAVDERGLVKSSTWWTVRDHRRGPAAPSRTRQAARAEMQSWVCRMWNSAASAAEPGGQGVDGGEDPLLEGRPAGRGRDDGVRRGRRPVEARRRIAERDHPDRVPGRVQRLGQGQRVDHPAARLGRVRDQADARRPAPPSRAAGASRRTASAAAARAARAARLGDDAPASGERRRAAGRAPAGRRRCRARRTTTARPGGDDLARRSRRAPRPGRGASRSRARRRAGSRRRRGRRPAPAAAPGARPGRSSGGAGPWCTPPRRGPGRCGAVRRGQPELRASGMLEYTGPERRRRGSPATRSRACRRRRGRGPAVRPAPTRAIARLTVASRLAAEVGRGTAERSRRRRQRAGLERGGRAAPASRPSESDMPTQAATNGVSRLAPITVRATSLGGWLGDEQDDVGARVGVAAPGRPRGPSGRRRRPMRSRPPTPITWDDADAPAVQQGHDLLRAGAGGGDDADPAGRDHVGEAEADAAEHGGARTGAHHQPAEPAGSVLQRDLLLERHVVAEQQDVQAGGQRLVGLERGVRRRGPRPRPRWPPAAAGPPRRSCADPAAGDRPPARGASANSSVRPRSRASAAAGRRPRARRGPARWRRRRPGCPAANPRLVQVRLPRRGWPWPRSPSSRRRRPAWPGSR